MARRFTIKKTRKRYKPNVIKPGGSMENENEAKELMDQFVLDGLIQHADIMLEMLKKMYEQSKKMEKVIRQHDSHLKLIK